MRNIYLIGMRGVGKSKVGRLLAGHLNREFFDSDRMIEKKEGHGASGIVKKKGWDYFRKREREVIQELKEKDLAIISVGGGAPMYFDNVEHLKATGTVIFLKASTESLRNRLSVSYERPSLTGKPYLDEIEDLWKERLPIYTKSADITVDTSKKSCEDIVDLLLSYPELL